MERFKDVNTEFGKALSICGVISAEGDLQIEDGAFGAKEVSLAYRLMKYPGAAVQVEREFKNIAGDTADAVYRTLYRACREGKMSAFYLNKFHGVFISDDSDLQMESHKRISAMLEKCLVTDLQIEDIRNYR